MIYTQCYVEKVGDTWRISYPDATPVSSDRYRTRGPATRALNELIASERLPKGMTPLQIRNEAVRIEHQELVLASRLERLQEICHPHPNVKVEHKSSTGHWDRSADSWWSEFSCPDCGKHWIVET